MSRAFANISISTAVLMLNHSFYNGLPMSKPAGLAIVWLNRLIQKQNLINMTINHSTM